MAPLVLAGTVALAAGGAGLALYLRQPAKPSNDEIVMQHITDAKALLDANEPQRAITEHLEPALALDPENPELDELKSRADAMLISIGLPTTPTTIPDTAPPPVRPRSPDVSDRGPALPVGGGASASAAAAAAQAAERDRQQKDLDEANAAIARGDYARARQLLTPLSQSTSVLAASARDKLAELQKRRKDAALVVYKEAQQFEANQRWKDAVDAFQRAHQTDESVVVDADVARVNAKRLEIAETKLKDADRLYKRQDDAAALQLYVEILDLLPESDSRYQMVRTRIAELRK
jgi:hypothetical protein